MNPEALHLLSIARKGRLIEAGEEPVSMACRAQHGRLVLVAADASPHTFRRVQSLTAGTKQPWIKVDATKVELGMAIGFSDCAVAAITDVQLALAFVRALGEPVKYADLLADLELRVQRVKQRRAEEKAHRDNVRRHKVRRTPTAAPAPEPVPAQRSAEPRRPAESSRRGEGQPEHRGSSAAKQAPSAQRNTALARQNGDAARGSRGTAPAQTSGGSKADRSTAPRSSTGRTGTGSRPAASSRSGSTAGRPKNGYPGGRGRKS